MMRMRTEHAADYTSFRLRVKGLAISGTGGGAARHDRRFVGESFLTGLRVCAEWTITSSVQAHVPYAGALLSRCPLDSSVVLRSCTPRTGTDDSPGEALMQLGGAKLPQRPEASGDLTAPRRAVVHEL